MEGQKVILSDGTIAFVRDWTADGSLQESMVGYDVPYNETTAIAYDLLVTWLTRAAKAE